MKNKTVAKSLLVISLGCTSLAMQAKTYLGFDLGGINVSQVQQQLTASQAQFDVNYGYHGFSEILRVFKVNEYDAFAKYGDLKESWMHFAPDKTLYRFTVSYYDAGKTFTTFKDALYTKYTLTNANERGFNKTYSFVDGEVSILLERNTFGFGKDQTTTLVYEYRPLVPVVDKKKADIDYVLTQQNAKKAGDL